MYLDTVNYDYNIPILRRIQLELVMSSFSDLHSILSGSGLSKRGSVDSNAPGGGAHPAAEMARIGGTPRLTWTLTADNIGSSLNAPAMDAPETTGRHGQAPQAQARQRSSALGDSCSPSPQNASGWRLSRRFSFSIARSPIRPRNTPFSLFCARSTHTVLIYSCSIFLVSPLLPYWSVTIMYSSPVMAMSSANVGEALVARFRQLLAPPAPFEVPDKRHRCMAQLALMVWIRCLNVRWSTAL